MAREITKFYCEHIYGDGKNCFQDIKENEKYCNWHISLYCEHEYYTSREFIELNTDFEEQRLRYSLVKTCKKCNDKEVDFIFDKIYNFELDKDDFLFLKEWLETKKTKGNK